MMTPSRSPFRTAMFRWSLWLLLAALPVSAQTVRITPLLSTQDVRDLLVLDDVLYGATASGGVAIWSPSDPSAWSAWTTVDGMSSNRINGLDWTGRHLWVATDGGGLTRVTLGETGPEFRRFVSADALGVAAVTGSIIGTTERVYYGLKDGGLGVINDGFAGSIFTVNGSPGLVDDRIRCLALEGEDLWIGTADGISARVESLISDRSAGLRDREVRDLLVTSAGQVLAATGDGVQRWDAGAAAWSPLGPDLGAVADLVEGDDGVWALLEAAGTGGRLRFWNGTVWSAEDTPQTRTSALAVLDGGLWGAGQIQLLDENPKAYEAFLARRDVAGEWRTWPTGDLPFGAVDGVEFDQDGTAWLGSRGAAGWAGWDGEELSRFVALAAADNDSLGLINTDSGLLTMELGADGAVWISQFHGGGIIRFDPTVPSTELITPENSALSNANIIRLVAHPDGPVFCLSDQNGVDLLIDPDRWRDDASWLALPQDDSGLGGQKFRDAAVTRRDRIWFTSDGGGLVLWDPNGSGGAADPLTLADPSDDWWSGPVTEPFGSSYDFRGCKGLAADPDGTLWAAGGSGLIHVGLMDNGGPGNLNIEVLDIFRELIDPSVPGLMRGVLSDVDLDRNGDVWVAHDAGLNRVRIRGDETYVDSYTNAASYESLGLGSLFSAAAIVGIPEGQAREVAASPDGRRLLVGTDFGAAVLEIGVGTGLDSGPLDAVYMHPNPYRPGIHGEGVRISGFESVVRVGTYGVSGGVMAEVFNLEGQLVYRSRNTASDTPFWSGETLSGGTAAPGTYLVRLELDGRVRVLPLAVVR